MLRIVGAICLLCWPLRVTAQAEDTAQILMMKCSGNPTGIVFTECRARISGIYDVMALNGLAEPSTFKQKMASICNNGVSPTWNERVQVFVNWMNNHPERQEDRDTLAVMAAERQIWPCR